MRTNSRTTLGCLLLVLAAACCAHASPYSDYVISSTGPVIYYDLNETAGPTATDLATAAGGANNGVYGGTISPGAAGPRPSDGFAAMAPDNKAPSVAGKGYVLYDKMATNASIPTDSYSLQTWFNSSADPLSSKVLQYIYTRGNSAAASDRRDGAFVMGSYRSAETGLVELTDGSSPAVVGTRVLEPNTWYHVAFVRDDTASGAKGKIYVNGKLEVESPAPWQGGTGENFVAGHRTDYHTVLGLTGTFDEVAVWDRALTPCEANLLYQAASNPRYAVAVLADCPEAYWRLNETSPDNTAADLTQHGHDFTYHARPTRTGAPPDVGPRGGAFSAGFEPDNYAPTLTGAPLSAGDGYLGIVGNVLPGENDYSIEMWFRPGTDANAYGDYLLHRNDTTAQSKGDYLGLTSLGTGHDYDHLFVFGGAPVPSTHGTTTLNKDEWYHVAMVRSGDYITVYLNGQVEIPTTFISPTGTWTDGTWTFGGRYDMPSQQKFSGNIDEIAIYSGALDQSVFQAHWAAAIPEPASCLLLGGALLALARRRRRVG